MFFPVLTEPPFALDAQMRASLADSLAHVHAVLGGRHALQNLNLAATLAEIRAHRVLPGVFGRYYELVFALLADHVEEAATLFQEIAALAARHPPFAVLPFSMDTLGSDATRYTRLLSFEADSLSDLASPDAERWQAFEQNVHAALSLLDTIDARLGEEVRALVIQVIGATPSPLNSGRSFGGASSLMLWGAILLNVNTHDSVVSVIAGLVHEAAHQLLFGLSLREPLVNNGIDERYNSPLRTDPRPMDGIFHATFVCARMHYAFARLLDQASTQFDREALDAIARHMHDERTGFIDGYETICRFGQITPTGKKIMDEASAYMQGVER